MFNFRALMLPFGHLRSLFSGSYSPFANSYLAITHFSELISEKVTDTVTDFLLFRINTSYRY